MDTQQLHLAEAKMPCLNRMVNGYSLMTWSDLCLAWERRDVPGGPERTFLMRNPDSIYYAVLHEPYKNELEILSRNQARELYRRLAMKIASEEEAFPTPHYD